jgi:hypothetical protein
MAFPQYRIPVERLKEEWAFRQRMDRLRSKRPGSRPPKLADNSEPWIHEPRSIDELLQIARSVNQTVAKWAPPQNSSES